MGRTHARLTDGGLAHLPRRYLLEMPFKVQLLPWRKLPSSNMSYKEECSAWPCVTRRCHYPNMHVSRMIHACIGLDHGT